MKQTILEKINQRECQLLVPNIANRLIKYHEKEELI